MAAGRLRLDAYLARAGLGTRSQVRRLIRSGRVKLGGEVCRHASASVGDREVRVDGAPVEVPPETLHAVLNKPVGYACSHDPREAPIIDELLPDLWLKRGLQAAGRLDRATSGLLVLSTDGALIHALTHPKRKVSKRYRVAYEGTLPPDAARRVAEGMVIRGSDEPTRPAELTVDEEARADRGGRATLWLREGRFHQARRMFEALGVSVTALHRDCVGDYALPADLSIGDYRRLEAEDLERLRKATTL